MACAKKHASLQPLKQSPELAWTAIPQPVVRALDASFEKQIRFVVRVIGVSTKISFPDIYILDFSGDTNHHTTTTMLVNCL